MTNEKDFNDDDRVRDHLANERTFLAWLRTGSAAIGLGIVIAKLRYIIDTKYAEPNAIVPAANIGLIFVVVGIGTIVLSAIVFLQVRNQIRTRSFVSKIKPVIGLTILMVFLGLVVLWYLIQPAGIH